MTNAIKTTGPIERTPNEIRDRIAEAAQRDTYGAERSRLLEALSFRDAQQFLRADAPHSEASWAELQFTTRERAIEEIGHYLPYAWGKTNRQRTSSIFRARAHFAGLVWLLGPEADELVEQLLGEPSYFGKPDLVALSELAGVNWREQDDGIWQRSAEDQGVTADQALGV